MNIADRIQSLRRSRGISQEQLADALGVSRQAVSKWEAEQSSPDLERIIAMAEYFDVTTDYILRGIEPACEPRLRFDTQTPCIISTALNVAGLIIGAAWWRTYQNAFAAAFTANALHSTPVYDSLKERILEQRRRRRAAARPCGGTGRTAWRGSR